MRSIPLALAVLLVSGPAFAQCKCTCVSGKSVAMCSSSAMAEPICQSLCLEGVGQKLSTPSVAAPSLGGGLSIGPSTSGSSLPAGIDPSALGSLPGQ